MKKRHLMVAEEISSVARTRRRKSHQQLALHHPPPFTYVGTELSKRRGGGRSEALGWLGAGWSLDPASITRFSSHLAPAHLIHSRHLPCSVAGQAEGPGVRKLSNAQTPRCLVGEALSPNNPPPASLAFLIPHNQRRQHLHSRFPITHDVANISSLSKPWRIDTLSL